MFPIKIVFSFPINIASICIIFVQCFSQLFPPAMMSLLKVNIAHFLHYPGSDILIAFVSSLV